MQNKQTRSSRSRRRQEPLLATYRPQELQSEMPEKLKDDKKTTESTTPTTSKGLSGSEMKNEDCSSSQKRQSTSLARKEDISCSSNVLSQHQRGRSSGVRSTRNNEDEIEMPPFELLQDALKKYRNLSNESIDEEKLKRNVSKVRALSSSRGRVLVTKRSDHHAGPSTIDAGAENRSRVEPEEPVDSNPEWSELYGSLKTIGWLGMGYTLFSPDHELDMPITYEYVRLEYLHAFEDNIERSAVHMKYGRISVCTCYYDGSDQCKHFCEKHIDVSKLQYYYEALRVMHIFKDTQYDVPSEDYDPAEEYLMENYPNYFKNSFTEDECHLNKNYYMRELRSKFGLIKSCRKILQEEDLLAEYIQCNEIIGAKRNLPISGRMKDLEEDFDLTIVFLKEEYPVLFVYLLKELEFTALSFERMVVGGNRNQVIEMSKSSPETLQKLDDECKDTCE